MIENPDMLAMLKNLDPKSDQFLAIAEEVAAKTDQLRGKERFLPYRLFIAALQMQGNYATIETLLFSPGRELYLKIREEGENKSAAEQDALGGKLHIPGTPISFTQNLRFNLYRLLAKEVVQADPFGDDPKVAHRVRVDIARLYRAAIILGCVLYGEPYRKTTALTHLFGIEIEDRSILGEGYQVVTSKNFDRIVGQIIDQHQLTVRKFLSCESLSFIDARKSTHKIS